MTTDRDDINEPTREQLEQLQRDAGIPHLPTIETYWYRMAMSGEGPHAFEWTDKPHRLVFDLCRIIEASAAASPPSPAGAVTAAVTDLLFLLDDYMVVTSLTANDRWSDAVDRLRAAIASPPSPAPAEGGAVAWMTADGRIATDETKRTAMASPSRAAFNIPLFPHPAAMGRVTVKALEFSADGRKEEML